MLKKMFTALSIILLFGSFNLYPQGIPRSAYVVNSVANTLSYLNIETQTVIVDTLSPGANSFPNQVVVHLDKGYVVNSGTNNLMIFDLATLQRDGFIQLPTGSNPWAMDFINDSLCAVSFFNTDEIGIVNVNTRQLVQTVAVGTSPEGVKYYGGKIYVANSGFVSFGQPYDPGTVSVVDMGSLMVVDTIGVGLNPQDLDVGVNGNLLVACTGDWGITSSGEMDIIDTGNNTVTFSVHLNSFITAVKVNGMNKAYLATFGSGVMVYDVGSHTFEIGETNPLTGGPGVAFDAQNNAYICEFGDGVSAGKLYVYSPAHQLLHTYTMNIGPVSVAIYDPNFTGISDRPVNRISHFNLRQNYPNPFNPGTIIEFSLTERSRVKLEIFDITGKRVRTLAEGKFGPGIHRFTWDGRDWSGRLVASGVYFSRLLQGKRAVVRKMQLLR